MRSKDELIAFTDELIAEGNAVIATKFQHRIDSFTSLTYVDLQPFFKWATSAMHLVQMLGPYADAWKKHIETDKDSTNLLVCAQNIQAALESIRDNLKAGRLSRIEELIAAETFANLLEQAEHLQENGYFLAGGALCRAVLEERLRMLCARHSLTPSKPRPTINDYAQALYAGNSITKIDLKGIEAMAAIGNDAAHNAPTLTAADVKRLYDMLVEFLQRHTI